MLFDRPYFAGLETIEVALDEPHEKVILLVDINRKSKLLGHAV
jgi:hypothetical protein